MPNYQYLCEHCYLKFERQLSVDLRNLPLIEECPRCREYEVIKVPTIATIRVPEGACGNSSNGYSSTVGDAERFKAKSEGRKSEY